jgi:hypothetical protein
MAMTEEKGNADEKQVNGYPSGKKPYQEPAFRHQRVFETRALSCGKILPDNRQCFFKRMSS